MLEKFQVRLMRFGNLIRCMVDDIIHTAEVVYRFHNIVNACVFGSDTKRIGLEDIACLLFLTFDIASKSVNFFQFKTDEDFFQNTQRKRIHNDGFNEDLGWVMTF